MGWLLVDEVLDHCPKVTYIEFRILVALARDARESTRQAMPGHELLALKGNCGLRTVGRAIGGLVQRGLIKPVGWPMPGRRAVYEILPMLSGDAGQQPVRRTSDRSEQRKTGSARTHDSKVSTPGFSNPEVHSPKNTPAKPPRDDVERLCGHLADRIEANGSKRPSVTQKWRDAARLMLDKDDRTEEQIDAAIDWCQSDEFWRANILSMPKLREKYDQLRLQASRRQGSRRQAETDDMFNRAMKRAMKRAEARSEPPAPA